MGRGGLKYFLDFCEGSGLMHISTDCHRVPNTTADLLEYSGLTGVLLQECYLALLGWKDPGMLGNLGVAMAKEFDLSLVLSRRQTKVQIDHCLENEPCIVISFFCLFLFTVFCFIHSFNIISSYSDYSFPGPPYLPTHLIPNPFSLKTNKQINKQEKHT